MTAIRWALALAAAPILAACTPPPEPTDVAATFDNVPPQVVEMAAPYQNVASARLLDAGCYWYSHSGPVETTLLPLKTRDGRPICLARQS